MTVATFPTTIDELTGSWLTEALRRSGRLHEAQTVALERSEPLSTGTSPRCSRARCRQSSTTIPCPSYREELLHVND
jgi:hypothetical protein